MKKTFTIFVLALMAMCNTFTACSSSDDNEDKPTKSDKKYKIKNDNIVGVWRNGNDFFVSFSKDGFNSSLLNNKFIDEGDYKIDGDTIFVTNNYFSKTTKYVVNAINDKALSITITYDDRWEGKKTTNMQFTKANDIPCTKNHILVGKSYYAQYSVDKTSQHWNKVFTTYNSMSCTRADVASSAPSTFYYIYLTPKIYFYVIRYGEFYYDNVRYGDVELDDKNQIDSMGYLYGQKL